jgi:hypothetical protein
MNGAIEFSDASEGLMSQIVRLQVVPDERPSRIWGVRQGKLI